MLRTPRAGMHRPFRTHRQYVCAALISGHLCATISVSHQLKMRPWSLYSSSQLGAYMLCRLSGTMHGMWNPTSAPVQEQWWPVFSTLAEKLHQQESALLLDGFFAVLRKGVWKLSHGSALSCVETFNINFLFLTVLHKHPMNAIEHCHHSSHSLQKFVLTKGCSNSQSSADFFLRWVLWETNRITLHCLHYSIVCLNRSLLYPFCGQPCSIHMK